MDYIFAPMSADRFVVESTLQFAVMFRDNLMTTGQAKTKGLYLFCVLVSTGISKMEKLSAGRCVKSQT